MTKKSTRPSVRSSPSRTGIREVADRAGVAVSSVSRVLSDHPDVSELMRNRVMDAVAALGYQPDRLAQSLRTGESKTVGFMVGDISNLLLSQIVLGAEIGLHDSGYSTLLTNSLNEPTRDLEQMTLLVQRRVDGLLLSLNDETNPEFNQALAALDIPAVLVDRQIEGIELSAVLSDHATGMRDAIDHLVSLGHRHIGLVNGNPRVRPSRERSEELRRAGNRYPDLTGTVRSSSYSAQHGYDTTLDLCSSRNGPTAIIAGGNQILIGVLGALREKGLSVPNDVSLVTCDDLPLSEFLEPELSTISREPRRIGEEAATLLLDMIQGEPARVVTLPTAFRPTASCTSPSQRRT